VLLDGLFGLPRDRGHALAELRRRPLNVNPAADHSSADGWSRDDVRRQLPSEPPGAPVPGGSWETACRIARDYDFADPSIVHGVYEPTDPLENRTMLLVLRFHVLRIHVGVRVGEVYDLEHALDGRRGRLFGWNYRTLRGHVEEGQMDWQVWKFADTGDVTFRICSFSRPARSGNLLLRLGFRLVGRREQLRFLHLTTERMARLTTERMGRPAAAAHPARS
jgi:hypothetical protein